MKIRFQSDDDFSLGKTFNISDMIITATSVFEKNGKYYLQMFLHECAYDLQKCYNTKNLMFQKKLIIIKQVHQKNVCFVIIGTLKMLDLDLNHMFVTNVMMF